MVGYDDLMARAWRRTRSTVEQGDFVCFRTGFDQVLLEFDRKPDESVHRHLRRARRPRRAAAAMGHRQRASSR